MEILESVDGQSFVASGDKLDPEFGNRFRIKLGRKGKIKGKEYTVVGRLRFDWEDDGDTGQSIEYVLYNDYEGYAWLDQEDGHLLFGKSIERPDRVDLFSMAPGNAVNIQGKPYRFLEKGELKLKYLDGAIPWSTEIDEVYRYAEAVAAPFVISEERTVNDNGTTDIEFSESEYVNQQKVAERFKTTFKPKGPHPAEPYRGIPGERGIIFGGFMVAILLFFGFCFAAFEGEPLHKEKFTSAQLIGHEVFTKPFTIQQPNQTIEIEFKTGMNNRWAEFGTALYDAKTSTVTAAEDGYLEYYSGYEGGEHWSEGSRNQSYYWKIKNPGEYQVLLTIAKTDDPDPTVPITVTITRNVRRAYLLILLALLWPILPTVLYFRRKKQLARRA